MFKPIVPKKLQFNLSESPVTTDIDEIKDPADEETKDFPIYTCWKGNYSTIVTFKEKTDLENFIKVISKL